MLDKDLTLKKLRRDLDALVSPEGYLYAGVPTKFMGLFGRDSLISGWQLLDYDSSFAKQALLSLAEIQGQKIDLKTGEEPGKIPHEFYSKNVPESWFSNEKSGIKWLEKEKPVYFSVDSTPLFLIVAGKYYRRTKDKNLIRRLKPALEGAINWIVSYGIINGFLRYGGTNPEEGLISQSWKDGIGVTLNNQKGPVAIVEVQGYTLQAAEEVKKLAEVLGPSGTTGKFVKSTQKLKEQFNKKFWMEEQGFYCLGIDGSDNQIKPITSNPGQLLFTGILDKERASRVVNRIFQKDMWTPYGVRTHSTFEPDFDPLSYQRGSVWPHDNWIIAQGLIKEGYKKEAKKVKEALFGAYQTLGFLPEFYGVTLDNQITFDDDNLEDKPVTIQAWSVGAMINFLTRK